jgi:uncharacterized protein (TIGR03083 family)
MEPSWGQAESMQITPVYDRMVLTIEGGPPIVPATVRQRRRLLDFFGSLTDEQWGAPSRCEGWRVQDVAAHLGGVDPYWLASITAGLTGEPTEFLRGFDPKATPAAMVDAAGAKSPAEIVAELRAATTALCDLVEGLDEAALSRVAESPPGHVAIRDLLHHALWDAWVHERDVALPLGVVPAEEPDEIAASLRYVAALNSVFALMSGTSADATLLVEAADPELRIVVSVTRDRVRVHDGDAPNDAVVVRGDAVRLTEVLSGRLPFDHDVPEDRMWLVRSLAAVFEI